MVVRNKERYQGQNSGRVAGSCRTGIRKPPHASVVQSVSIIDLTLRSGDIRGTIRHWRVADEDKNLNDHSNIYFHITNGTASNSQDWKYGEEDDAGFLEAFDEEMNRKGECEEGKLDRELKRACEKILKKKGRNSFMPVYC